MKRKLKPIFGVLIVVIITSYGYNHFLNRKMIIGRYINDNPNYGLHLVETPTVSDTLTLYDDYSFQNNFWGKGTYRLTYSASGTTIEFTYESGKALFETRINRLSWGKPHIILSDDLEYYYRKVD